MTKLNAHGLLTVENKGARPPRIARTRFAPIISNAPPGRSTCLDSSPLGFHIAPRRPVRENQTGGVNCRKSVY